MSVELEQTSSGGRGPGERVEVERIAFALAQDPSGGVSDRVDPGMLDRPDEPARELLLGLIDAVMDRRHDVVRLCQDVVGKIELPGFQDIEFHALQNRETAAACVPFVDGLPLFPQPLGVQPARHRDPL